MLAAFFLLFALDSLAQTQDCDCFTECDNYVRNGGFEASFEQFLTQDTTNIPCWENVIGTPHIYDRDNTNCLFSIPAIIPVGGSFPPWIIETWDHDISNNQTLCLTGQESVRSELNFPILNNSTFNIEFHFLRPDSFVNVTLDSLYIGFSNVELTSNIWSNPAMHIFSFELTYEDYADGFNQWGLINDTLLNNSGVAFTHIYIGRDFSLGGLVWVDDIRITDQQSESDATIALNYEFQNDSIIYICHNSVDSIGLFPSPSLNCPIFWTSNEVPVFGEFEEHCLDTASTFNSLISTDTIVYLLPDTTTTYTVHSFGCATDFTFTIVVLPEEDNEYLLDDTLLFECPYDTVNLMTYFSGDSADFYLDSLSNFLVDDLLQVNELDTSEHTLFAVFTSESGCPDTLERVFFVPQTIQLDSLFFSEYLCAYQDCVGEAEVFATTSNTPLQYFWNDANIPSDTSYVDTLCHGINALRIVDSLGCILDTTINISFFECTWTVDFTVGDTALSCYGDVTSIGISINGGTGPVTIICDSDTICELTLLPTLYVLTNVHGGAHHIIVQDALCCQEDTIIYIAEAPDQISMNITTQNNTCYDQCNGSFDVEVTGGIEPYQFFWTLNGLLQSNTEDIDSLCSGQYAFGILDENSCFTVYDSLVIEEICCAEIVINLDSTYFSCPGVAEAGAYISVSGGAEPYSFIWNGPTASGLEDPINMIPGDYTLVVVDAYGCSDSLEVVIPSTPMAEDPNNAGFVIPVGTSDWDITTWGTTDVYFDEDITVPDSAILNITGLNLFFTPGHGINVLPNGLLNAENCKFDVACGLYWDGIRVEASTISNTISRGSMTIGECELRHALVAIANHQILLPSGVNPFINITQDSTGTTTTGGYIKALNCYFKNNKRDLDLRKNPNQVISDEEAYLGNCEFWIDSVGLPVTPMLSEYCIRIVLLNITNVVFSDCNLNNNKIEYFAMYPSNDNEKLIGLYSGFSTFHWNENSNVISRIFHFRKGMRVSGDFLGQGTGALGSVIINNTTFNNFVSLHCRSDFEVMISNNVFINPDGEIWGFDNYPSNAARPIGMLIEGTNNYGIHFTVVNNFVNFVDVNGSSSNHGIGIQVNETRGVDYNLIYNNIIKGCDRYGMYFFRRNRNSSPISILGTHYECNIFGDASDPTKKNDRDVYVQNLNTSEGIAPMQYNSFVGLNSESAGNKFLNINGTTCDDIDYQNSSTATQTYRVFIPSELNGTGDICDVAVLDNFTNQTVLNQCSVFPEVAQENIDDGFLIQELASLDFVRSVYINLKDAGNTEALKSEVLNSTLSNAYQLYEELLSVSPNLSEEVMLEAIKKEYDLPAALLTLILASNPSTSKSEVLTEAINTREIPLSDYQIMQILEGSNSSGLKEMLEQEMAIHSLNIRMEKDKKIRYMMNSVAENFEIIDFLNSYDENTFREDLFCKSRLMRKFGLWDEAIELFKSAPDRFLLSSYSKQELINESELLDMQNQIFNVQNGIPSIDQIRILEEWGVDHNDGTCLWADELLFLFTGRHSSIDCTEGEFSDIRSMVTNSSSSNSNSIRAFPNPASDYCVVEFDSPISAKSKLTMFDVTGKVIQFWKLMEGQTRQVVSLISMPAGCYMFQLTDIHSNDFHQIQIMKYE
jgi:hypothetical protein